MSAISADHPGINHVEITTIFFVAIALGIGLIVVLLGEFGNMPYSYPEEGSVQFAAGEQQEHYTTFLAISVIEFAIVLAPLIGAVTGVLGVRELGEEYQSLPFVAAGAVFGGFLVVLLVGLLAQTGISEDFVGMGGPVGIDVDGYIVNSLIGGVATGLTSLLTAVGAIRLE